MMPTDDLEASIRAVKHWADAEIARLVYAGTRPLSICSTVEAAAREAAIAHGNAIAHSAEIAEVESVAEHASQCLSALERFARLT